MKKVRNKTGYHILYCILIFGTTFQLLSIMSHSQSKTNIRYLPTVERLYGWSIPGINDIRVVKENKTVNENGLNITQKIYNLSVEPIIEVETYILKDDGNLEVKSNLCVVSSLSSFEIEGNKFAYRANLTFVDINYEGVRNYIGTGLILYYFDEDGNGSFETRAQGLDALHVPEWAKSNRKK